MSRLWLRPLGAVPSWNEGLQAADVFVRLPPAVAPKVPAVANPAAAVTAESLTCE